MDIIFDIDGTLADASHRIHHLQKTPKDWEAFYAGAMHDAPIKPVVHVMDALYNHHSRLILCTGRPSNHKDATLAWLDKHFIGFDMLYMRVEGDHRNDDIVKEELLDQMIADGYNPVLAFEDRKRVADMFRRRGLIVAHVAEGDF